MTEPRSILVVDDDAPVGEALAALLKQDGNRVKFVTSAADALGAIERGSFDCVVSDVRMPKMDGIELLAHLKKGDPALPIIMITAYEDTALTVEAMRLGAADFLTKPYQRETLIASVNRAMAVSAHDVAQPPKREPAGGIVGSSPALMKCLERVRRAAKSEEMVLLHGESGTGKELVARALHDQSERRDGPYVAVNCGAIPETLVESELFGHEKGVFTSALKRVGKVALAEGGTLFLDEIGELPYGIQAKLLRLLDLKTYAPIGEGDRKADVRFVAATHRNLAAMVEEGTFRQDLFYRLNIIKIDLPPLRDRDDIEELAQHFLEQIGASNGRPSLRFSPEALAVLSQHTFPGNVRELRSVVSRLVVFCDGGQIEAADVAEELPGSSSREGDAKSLGETLERKIRALKREAVERALRITHGNKTEAATLLGIARRTLHNWMDELGMNDEP